MEGKPKRLRPWLESLINSRMIPGLEWEDEERNLFRIPWKHRGKHDWSPGNGRIFMEWAKHTGRYREGVDSPDYPAWKTRLRCAFNKAPDIEEVKDLSQMEDACPYRVYRLKPLSKIGSMKHPLTKTHLGPIKPTKSHSLAARRRNGHSIQDGRHAWTDPKIKIENDVHAQGTTHYNNEGYHDQNCAYAHIKPETYDSPLTQRSPDGDCDMVIKVMYGGKEVLDRTIRSPWGCRVSYGLCPLSPLGHLESITGYVENIYGTSQAESVSLPSCVGLMKNEKQERLGMELLERGLRRGIVLKCKDNDLYAYRLCQSAVFYSSRLGTDGMPVKLRRADVSNSEPGVRLFDYHAQYTTALKDYLDGKGNKPDPYCYLVFGQEASLFNLDSNVLVVIAVASRAALHDLEKAETQIAVRTPKAEVSDSNELDSLARTLMSLCQSQEATQPNLAVKYSPTESVPASSSQSPRHQSLCNATNHTQQNQSQEVIPMEEDTASSTDAPI